MDWEPKPRGVVLESPPQLVCAIWAAFVAGSERCHETSSCDKCHTFPQVSGVNFPPVLPTRMSILPQESSYTQKITRCCTGT